jgi:hypothetical protein
MFRAIYVPAGEHTITMTYQPAWLHYGGSMWLMGMLGMAVLYGGLRLFMLRDTKLT